MKMSEISKKDSEALIALGKQLREELRAFRFSGAGGRKRDVKEGKNARRAVARIETELTARKLASKAK